MNLLLKDPLNFKNRIQKFYIKYVNENEILAKSEHPEKTYINEIMPAKLKLNLAYVAHHNLGVDIKIILLTIKAVF